ncbi:hydroxymethylbilane synthase [Acetobacterium bakii]|uniref:Porphobilinogen deaminase n=1 Tax=Acetobacterium bakii TaxID=52689 RepID=A0A0L6TZU7_9FIRM|nr:hydroxymethylbilane synthase [Acetobacterium bakii]KNZ41095.1 uroporphyrinogen III synthase [Acetobacterium bakii]
MNIKVGTRGSTLARVQSQWLIDVLAKAHPQIKFEMVIIKTKGDLVQDKPLDKIGDKGLFTKELEDALLSGVIHMAIHSMKDMPSQLPEGLMLTLPTVREDPRDVLLTPHKIDSLAALPQGAVVATGSKRRISQLKKLRPDVEIVGIRGNIDTRIRKMQEQKLDGIILAAAGLKRIGRFVDDAYETVALPEKTFIPAPAQGILAVEIRADNELVKDLMKAISDPDTIVQMNGERSFLKTLNGSCHIPVGAYVEMKNESIKIYGLYGLEDMSRVVTRSIEGPPEEAEALGKELGLECYKAVHTKPGKVYLAGGGCGDPGLLTVKAMGVLKRADVIVYDALVNESFLNEAKEGAEIVYVGKRAGNHAMPQEDINALLIEKGLEGKTVLRLKGGDPYVFGRGGEEGEDLYDADVPFEVIPGITSVIGGLAYAGIPITHRDCVSSFHVITGHLKSNAYDGSSDLDWPVLGKLKGTIVFLMGVKNLKKICAELVKNGMDAQMPVAVVHRASTPYQRVVVGNLETIYEIATDAKITAPSLIVVGEVVNKREKLRFFDEKPLFGKTIIVTRSREQSSQMSEKIVELGGNPIEYPTIKIVPINEAACDEKVKELDKYTHIVFTSINGVEIFFDSLKRSGKDARAFGKLHITAIGEGTKNSLLSRGLTADFVPDKYVGEELVNGLAPLLTKDSRVLIPRSKNARIYVVQELSKICPVDEIQSYETIREDHVTVDPLEMLKNKEIDYITFTSSTTVEFFVEKIGAQHLAAINAAKCVSIGPQTSKKCLELGIGVDIEAEQYTIQGMLDAILKDTEK